MANAGKTEKSVEEEIKDKVKEMLDACSLQYTKENKSPNDIIEKALKNAPSKTGGVGGNRPDYQVLVRDSRTLQDYPVLIECKGYKNKLEKLNANGIVDNENKANINSYAVNGAIHYSKAVIANSKYKKTFAVGITGFIEDGKLRHRIAVYYCNEKNKGYGQKVAEYSDFSFLSEEHFNEFLQNAENTEKTQKELELIHQEHEENIAKHLTDLNNHIYRNESNISEQDRVYLVVASIIANLGIEGKVAPLEPDELTASTEKKYWDGQKIYDKVESFVTEKNQFNAEKNSYILRTLANVLTLENINKPSEENGSQKTTQVGRIFKNIVEDLGYYYKIGLTTDFTGKLFNEMFGWLGYSQDKLNDVVLTPPYVSKLLSRLCLVNMDSYVWDYATGSAGLLVAAMNEMIDDANIKLADSPLERNLKIAKIKAEQLLGLEVLPSIYMLAVLNMILMGDGSSNIINDNSLTYEGTYRFGKKMNEEFPATAFVLNPPYSASGCGMVFVEKALARMKSGKAAVIIQSSAGTGKAKSYNIEILKHSRLVASIKMPIDLFAGKSSVQTYIYVFDVGTQHQKDDIVKFIDFSNDGYTRANRKKAKASSNLRDTDHAKERYDELVKIVYNKKRDTHFIDTEKEVFENTIDPDNGEDWNQSVPVDTKPTLADFKKTVSDYLAWEVSNILKKNGDDSLGK